MVSRRNFLKNALAEESRAYGFTIAFWGSGALLVKHSGVPDVQQALLYGIGAITGFALLNLYVYRSAFTEPESEGEKLLVLSMIHYFGSLLPIAAAGYLAKLESPANFFLTGLSVSILYNLGMVIEEILSEKGEQLEERLYRYI